MIDISDSFVFFGIFVLVITLQIIIPVVTIYFVARVLRRVFRGY